MTSLTPVDRRWVAVDHPGWRQAHASSVLLVDRDLLAAWFAGTREGPGVIQPALWHDNRTVYALMRSSEGRAYRALSTDGGRTWSTAAPVDLPNNNSGLTVVGLPGGVACVHNPVQDNWGARCPLVLSTSGDNGSSWRRSLTIEDGRTPVDGDPVRRPSLSPAPGGDFVAADDGVRTTGVGEYSYPSAIVVDETLIVTYTWQRRGFVEARVPIESLVPEGLIST
jgi:predicted neuraminidase